MPAPRPAAERTAPTPSATRESQARPDIQGLRAVAVGLVVLYHLRPDKLSGGFIGVDVFFVISGFLIVGSLGREAARTGTVSLRTFYARRVRRLLPASSFVLVAVMAGTVALLPVSRWQSTAEGLLASVLQSQNWWQAFTSGYDAATAAVSPLQHYWSLAVEEQFYLVAPLLLIAACWLSARLGRSRHATVIAVVTGVAVVSFAHSVTFSETDHDVAYFATTTRMWELSLGGLLALVGHRVSLRAGVRALAAMVGLLAIAWSAYAFDGTMAFPGWIALAPALGTAVVILGGQPDRHGAAPAGAQRLLGSRPFTYVGDISYSLYLWHWPLIVFWAFWVRRPPTKVECVALVVVALALAHVTTRYVEAPFRRVRPRTGSPRAGGRSRSGALRLAAALTAVSVAAGVGPWLYVQQHIAQLGDQRLDAQHPGAASTLPDELPGAIDIAIIPDPALAAADQPTIAGDGCAAFDPRQMPVHACLYADLTSPLTVVVAGDSHAGQFTTPISAIAESQGWRLRTMVRNGCPFMAAPIIIGGEGDWDCATANHLSVQRLLEEKPQLLVVSAMRPDAYASTLGWSWESEAALVDGYRRLWAPLLDAGIRIAVIRDTPTPDYVGPECVSSEDPYDAACSLTRAEADQQSDPLVTAAKQTAGVELIDLTDHLCNRDICPAVIGNVLVYRDNHLTDTLAVSLAPALNRLLVDLA